VAGPAKQCRRTTDRTCAICPPEGVDVAWTPAPFARRRCSSELGVVVALWALVIATISAFDRVGRRAAVLLVPYLL